MGISHSLQGLGVRVLVRNTSTGEHQNGQRTGSECKYSSAAFFTKQVSIIGISDSLQGLSVRVLVRNTSTGEHQHGRTPARANANTGSECKYSSATRQCRCLHRHSSPFSRSQCRCLSPTYSATVKPVSVFFTDTPPVLLFITNPQRTVTAIKKCVTRLYL